MSSSLTIFQSTLPRRERQQAIYDGFDAEVISIHAPAKGATVSALSLFHQQLISIHAPAKGATVEATCINPTDKFQSTLPRRERLQTKMCSIWLIHFNPRSREGSDASSFAVGAKVADFNPRSREGSDLLTRIHHRMYSLFQSTLPRRERPMIRDNVIIVDNISIHAPAKGATASYL